MKRKKISPNLIKIDPSLLSLPIFEVAPLDRAVIFVNDLLTFPQITGTFAKEKSFFFPMLNGKMVSLS